MTGYIIRPMTPEDVPATMEMRARTRENAVTATELAEEYGITPDSARKALERDQTGWLCEDAGKVVAFDIGDRSNGEVVVVAVLPDYEGKGIGRTILRKVQDMLYAAGWDTIWLLANPDPAVRATGFYHHMGWVSSGTMVLGDLRLERRCEQTLSNAATSPCSASR